MPIKKTRNMVEYGEMYSIGTAINYILIELRVNMLTIKIIFNLYTLVV